MQAPRDEFWIHGGAGQPEEPRPPVGHGVRARLAAWRRRPGARRLLKVVSTLMIVAALGMLGYPFATNLYADARQSSLEREFGSDDLRRAYVRREIRPGQALTRIRIPELGVDTIVVEGTTPSALRAGSGHYENTALPCEKGNSAIAGHRTTYSKPFAQIDELGAGDEIILETPIGRCWYRVEKAPFITSPYDWSIVRNRGGAHLTLTTCNPPGSARERLVVQAKLVRTEFAAPEPA